MLCSSGRSSQRRVTLTVREKPSKVLKQILRHMRMTTDPETTQHMGLTMRMEFEQGSMRQCARELRMIVSS